jgi:alpha-L-fucosidase
MRIPSVLILAALLLPLSLPAQSIFLEAEGFGNIGGWTNDNQSVSQMGSPYLIAHGLGRPVADAETVFEAPEAGEYRLWVRTRDWTRPWGRTESPGRFQVIVNGKPSEETFGTKTEEWAWQDGGTVNLTKGENKISLHDLTGFEGRCDAIYLTRDLDAEAPEPTADFRRKALGIKASALRLRSGTGDGDGTALRLRSGTGQRRSGTRKFDFVVVGGGIAGICAAITAARLGSTVALVQNRPVLGGNNSSEIRVGLSGLIYKEPYPQLGRLMDEIGGIGYWTNVEAQRDPDSPRSKHILDVLEKHPEKHIHNAGPASNYEDEKKLQAVLNEPNITLFLSKEVISAKTRGGKIRSVVAKDIFTSEEIILKGRLFADCTGDANLGFLAGADYRMGRESRAETGETQAPEKADSLTMGTLVQWFASALRLRSGTEDGSGAGDGDGTGFPECPWAIQFNDSTCIPIVHGEWDWETGLGRDQVAEIERIRDHGLRAVYGNWAYLKNSPKYKEQFEDKQLEWVACIGGKRESRRLMGDVILKEQDFTENVQYDDASFTATWGMDLHYPKPEPGMEGEEPFRAISVTKHHADYAVPYRCLYSRNIDNLLMAGRDISVTHAALGTIRVMRTGGMMGEVVGMAASICKDHRCTPRGVYQKHLPELKALMTAGVPFANIVKPNKVQQDWAEAEIGVLLHLDMPVFHPEYNHREYGTHPDPATFNPTELNTDQWLETAAKLGAKYAVLTAKHGSGFTLWPTSTHDYNISRSPWKDGKGDIVKDFVNSCHKYGIKPGIYANMATNGYLWVDNPGLVQPGSPITQEQYSDIIMRQLTELWGNYGPLFEVWFDGGILSPAQGGADVSSLIKKLQPEAIAFQGPYGYDNMIRWVGNEVGTAPDPCWATADSTTNSDGVKVVTGLNGRPDAPFWCPGESDFTLRRQSAFGGGWIWHEGQDDMMYSIEELMDKYETSVGRNTNMLLGLVIDNRGLIPDADVKQAEKYGEAIRKRYGNPCAETSGKGALVELNLKTPTLVDRAILQEEIAEGERVLTWHLEGAKPDGTTIRLCEGTNIGHKRIARFEPVELSSLKLVLDSYKAEPLIRRMAAFNTNE